MLSIRNPITEVDHALGSAFTPDIAETYTVEVSVDGNDFTATIADSSGVIDTVTATVAGTFNDGFLLFGTDNGGESCITDAELSSCVAGSGGGDTSDPNLVTITFDGETAGDRLPLYQEYTEGGFGYIQVNPNEGATFFDAGGGDIGLRDYRGDAAGAPMSFYALDGSTFEFVSIDVMNMGTDKYPTWPGSHSMGCNDENGTRLASEWFIATPNATSPENYTTTAFDGLECATFGIGFMGLGVQDSAVTSITFRIISDDADGDGIDASLDCDDNDASVGLATTWYPDDDADGFGELTGGEVEACDAPSGYVGNSDDICDGDDATGDADADGTCFDMEDCDTDADKLLEGDCGCGTADEDLDGNGISDCLDNSLTLEAETSHVRWFDTKTGKRKIDGVRYTWDKNKSHAKFNGTMELGGGLLAPDFRDASDNGLASIQVTMGASSPVSVYDSGDLLMDVFDQCSASTSDNREKWKHYDRVENAYERYPYSHERAVLRWRNSMRYRSWQESSYPAMSDEDNVGRIHSKFIGVDESRVRVRWNRKSDLPLTVAINGVTLVSIEDNGDNGDNTYTVSSAYDTETVYRGNGTERTRVIDVMYPDNLAEGDELVWYSGTDLTGTELYNQTLEENAASTTNTDSVWYNAGGRFNLRVPLGDDIIAGTLTEASTASEQVANVTITVGDTTTPGSSVSGSVTYSGYVISDGHWRIAETDEDTNDGGNQGSSGGASSGQGGNQAGTTCQTNAADDPEP